MYQITFIVCTRLSLRYITFTVMYLSDGGKAWKRVIDILPMRYRVVNERRIPVYDDRTEGCLAAAARLAQHAFAATVLRMRTSAYFQYLATDNIFVNPNNYLINCQVIVQSCYFRIKYNFI